MEQRIRNGDENDEGGMRDKDDHQGFLFHPSSSGCLLLSIIPCRRVSEFLFVGVSQRFFSSMRK
jgi:hypothetical protein